MSVSEILDTTLSKIEIATGEAPRKNGAGWIARRPAHDDKSPSLSVGAGENGRVLLHCQAGCESEAVLEALGLKWPDLFPDKPKKPTTEPRRIVAECDYRDGRGNLLFQVVRFVPKDLRQRRSDGNGGWLWGVSGVERVLYCLPQVLEAVASGERVYIVEGERDADALRALGLTATTNAGGAGKWRREYNESLRSARVAIVPDADEPGGKQADQVAASLHGIAREVKIVSLPGLREKGDGSDWIANGGTREQLERLAEDAPAFTPRAQGTRKAGRKKKEQAVDLDLTELDNARRFANQHEGRARYCHPWGRWLCYDGKRWRVDNSGEIERFAKQTVREIHEEARKAESEERHKALLHGRRRGGGTQSSYRGSGRSCGALDDPAQAGLAVKVQE